MLAVRQQPLCSRPAPFCPCQQPLPCSSSSPHGCTALAVSHRDPLVVWSICNTRKMMGFRVVGFLFFRSIFCFRLPLQPIFISAAPVADHFRKTPPCLPEYFYHTLFFSPTQMRTSFAYFGETQLKREEYRGASITNVSLPACPSP